MNNKEELKYVIRINNQAYKVYFIFILLILAFFMLFPMWHAGRQGIWLWLTLVIVLIFVLARQLISKNNVYLLTNRRILFLKAINKQNWKPEGSVSVKNIREISTHGLNNICLLVNERKFYITGTKNRDQVIDKIKAVSDI